MAAAVLTADGRTTSVEPCGTGGERESSQSFEVQEIAAEVLRLRLVQSQHKQVEAQLRTASEKLQQLPSEKVLIFRYHLEQGLRPGGGVGTLGGLNGGVDPESLMGLMESICVVCNVQAASRRQTDLLAASRFLLQDPSALIERLVKLPPAPTNESRRLAPFLLNVDSGWKGPMSEAGQCYELFRNWLSCYYQFSQISSQMNATSEQLNHQERQLEELSKDVEGGTGAATSGRTAPWRMSSNGVRRSSSVQSNVSIESRRRDAVERSPSPDKAIIATLQPSPRSGSASGLTRMSSGPNKAPAESPMRTTTGRLSTGNLGSSYGGVASKALTARASMASPGRSTSPQVQPASARTLLTRQADKSVASPRTQRLGPPQSSAMGTLGSARTSTSRTSGLSAPGAPPPKPSPRGLTHSQSAAPPSSANPRRHIVPAVRARRSPSREQETAGAPSKVAGSFVASSSPALASSRSLQSISEPAAKDATPPISSRTQGELNSARARMAHITPMRAHVPVQPHTARPATAHRAYQRLSSGAGPGAAGSGGTPAATTTRRPGTGYAATNGPRASLPLPSQSSVGARRLSPSESASMLQTRQTDAGSGGTVSISERAEWSLTTSRSASAIHAQTVAGRVHVSRETPTATPRPWLR